MNFGLGLIYGALIGALAVVIALEVYSRWRKKWRSWDGEKWRTFEHDGDGVWSDDAEVEREARARDRGRAALRAARADIRAGDDVPRGVGGAVVFPLGPDHPRLLQPGDVVVTPAGDVIIPEGFAGWWSIGHEVRWLGEDESEPDQ